MCIKEAIKKEIEEKEQQLARAKSESFAWNKGKFKNSSNAQVSNIYVESLKKEISNLYKKFSEIENEST